jgi:molybdopterin-guanine dinucleotide biosynthesis protein A
MHGVLLTGGASSRMGSPKAAISFDGVTLARRAADALGAVASDSVAVGPAFDGGLRSVSDPSEGPLVAFVCGADAFDRDEPTFLVACDVPFVSAAMLERLELGVHDAVVPVVDGRDQPSISLYSPRAIDVARRLVRDGTRSLRAWLEWLDVRRIDGDDDFLDVDTPDDLARARALLRERGARIVGRRDAGAEDRELRGD